MNTIDNPMVRLARLYSLVEAQLRRAASENEFIPMGDLQSNREIMEAAKNELQVKYVVNSLRDFGHIKTVGDRARMRYMWDVDSPPFVFGSAKREKMRTAPSEPIVKKSVQQESLAEPTVRAASGGREVEFVFNGVEFVVGINPATGNLRLKIEQT